MPRHLCAVMTEPLERAGVAVHRYHVDDTYEIIDEPTVASGALLVFVNHFGLKDGYAADLAARLAGRLVVDNSQAYFSPPPQGAHTIYSPRKFFGVPDGAYLYTGDVLAEDLPLDMSQDRCAHLLGRREDGAQAHYEAFRRQDAALSQIPLRRMSPLTSALLANIDQRRAQSIRIANARMLHEKLGKWNLFPCNPLQSPGPMVYPFLGHPDGLREALLAERIYVPTYWPETPAGELNPAEQNLRDRLLPLPVDQRYGAAAMERIAATVARFGGHGAG